MYRKLIGSACVLIGAFASGGSAWVLFGPVLQIAANMREATPTAFLGLESRFILTPLMMVGGLVFTTGLRLLAPTANESLAGDDRPPIILLRSFRDDRKTIAKSQDGLAIMASYFTFSAWTGDTFEEVIAQPLAERG